MFCPKCGSELPNSAAFCGKCGTPVGSKTSTKTFPGVLSSAAATLTSLPKVALAAIIGIVVIAGGIGAVTLAIPHGDIPNGTYAVRGSAGIGKGGSVEIWGNTMSIKHIAGSVYDTSMAPYRVVGSKLYYEVDEDDYFWINRFYTSTSDGRIVFDYRRSGSDIVLDDTVYYKR